MFFRATRTTTTGILTAMLLTLTGCGGSPADADVQGAAAPGGPTVLGAGPGATPTPLPSAASLADVLALVAAAPKIKTLPKDLTPALQNAAKDYGGNLPGAKGCDVSSADILPGACVGGDRNGSRTLLLLGDSHAGMWRSGFDEMGKRRHWKVIVLAKQCCPPLSMSIFRPAPTGAGNSVLPFPECSRWFDYVVTRINETSPDVVVLTSTRGTFDSNGGIASRTEWIAGRRSLFARITSPTTKKVTLGDMPGNKGPDCLAAHDNDVQACSIAVSDLLALDEWARVASTEAGAQYVDVTPWFCSSVCTAVIGNMLVGSTDGGHVSSVYASYLSGVLAAALQPIMDGR